MFSCQSFLFISFFCLSWLWRSPMVSSERYWGNASLVHFRSHSAMAHRLTLGLLVWSCGLLVQNCTGQGKSHSRHDRCANLGVQLNNWPIVAQSSTGWGVIGVPREAEIWHSGYVPQRNMQHLSPSRLLQSASSSCTDNSGSTCSDPLAEQFLSHLHTFKDTIASYTSHFGHFILGEKRKHKINCVLRHTAKNTELLNRVYLLLISVGSFQRKTSATDLQTMFRIYSSASMKRTLS